MMMSGINIRCFVIARIALLFSTMCLAINVQAESSFSVLNGTLVFTEPINSRAGYSTVNDKGYLVKFLPNDPPSLKTFSMDVGVNKCRVIVGDWLSAVPHMYVIGVEANHHLTSHFEYSDATKAYRDRAIIIPAAVSVKSGIATFNRGAGWENVSDVGSLFGWQDSKREAERKKYADSQQTVRLIALSDVLVHVAPPEPPLFMWDTLKIDIQGSDVEALISAGDYLKNFVCVVGEFQFLHYAIPKDVPTDPAPTLKDAGFLMVHDGRNNQIWFNKRYSKEYLANPELFGCHRVYDSKMESAALAKDFQKVLDALK